MLMLGVEFGFTVIKSALELTINGAAQLAFEVISNEITSLLLKVLLENVFEFVPILTLFFFH